MSTSEQVWFAVGISDFVILLEGAINYLGQKLLPKANLNIIKFIGGIII